jgi:hypothetical protein
MLQASMFVGPERSFHLPIYAQKMAHALSSSERILVPTPRFCGDPWVFKYLDIYADQDGLVDKNGNLASPLSLFCHFLVILLDLLPSLVARQTSISYFHFIIDFHYA